MIGTGEDYNDGWAYNKKIDSYESNDEIRKFQKWKKDEQKNAAQGKIGGESAGMKRKADDDGGKHHKKDWKAIKAEAKLKKEKRKEWKGGSEAYMLGVRSKKIWEELRQSNCKKERKTELCKELWNLVKGKVKSLIFSHDTVRVIETLMAVGGEQYRTELFEEMKNDILEMSKNKYSRFFVLKILRYGSRDQKDFVIKSLKGHTATLMKNKIACDVVELAYNDYANAKQRSLMTQEFYGPSFRLFPNEEIRCLEDALNSNPLKKETILKDLRSALQPIVDKGVFTNTMVHTLLRDFLTSCSEADRTAMIESLRESLLPIVHTRDGARVAMICLWHGTGKDRKVILKSFRTHMVKLATDPQGYMVLLAAFDCVDDVVFLKSVVIKELLEGIQNLVGADSGLRVLRYIVAPRSSLFFQPAVVDQLKPGDGNAYSRKDTDIRQREIQEAAADGILSLLSGNIQSWALNANWTLFIAAALETLPGSYVNTIFGQLAELCNTPYEEGMKDHVLEVAHTTKMLTKIIKFDKHRYAKEKPTFSEVLLTTVGEQLSTWLDSNRGCFMLVCMIETEISKVIKSVKDILSQHLEKIVTLTTPGGKILSQKLKEDPQE
ncbi:pumilio homolog 3 [Penaeus vannamei]|uniref:pumilio homolog 3 n=1 Tax=Penaeus vannamei TaxID=6689 RepID=UPI00387F9100